jgi:hypothetical protein
MNERVYDKLLLILMILTLSACQPAAPAPLPVNTPIIATTNGESSPTIPAEPTTAVSLEETVTPDPTPLVGEPSPVPDNSLNLVPVTQYGGSITAFAVENDLLFSAQGPRLEVYNIVDPTQPQQIGEPFPLNITATDLAVDGNTLYMVNRDKHLLLFQVTYPETIYLSAAFEGAGSSQIYVQGSWGFTTSDTCIDGSCTSQLKLFSLADLASTEPVFSEGAIGPALPVIATLEVPGAVVNVFSDDQHAYIAHQNGILILNLADLQITGQLASEFGQNAAFLPPYIYLVGWGFLQVADISDPTNPVWVNPVIMDDHPSVGGTVAIAGQILYGYNSIGEFGHCWSELHAAELSFPGQPAALALDEEKPSLSCALYMEGYQDLILALDWNGLHLIDVSEPGFPTLASRIDNQPGVVEVLVNGYGYGRLGIGLDSLMVHDFNDLESIRPYGPFSPGWISRIVHREPFLFIPAWEDGLHVVNISDPSSPATVSHTMTDVLAGPGIDAALSGDQLYVARAESGIAVFDIIQTDQPGLIGQYSPPQLGEIWTRTSRIAAGDGFVIALDEMWQDNLTVGTLNIFRLSGAAQLQPEAQVEIEAPFLGSALIGSGNSAYFMSSGCRDSCAHRILILNLDDPTQPRIVSSIEMPGEAFALTLYEYYLFVAAGTGGVYAFDIRDPSQPVLAAHIRTAGTAKWVAVENSLVVVSDSEGGMVVYQFAE